MKYSTNALRVAADVTTLAFPAPAGRGLTHLYGLSFALAGPGRPLAASGNLLELLEGVALHGVLRIEAAAGPFLVARLIALPREGPRVVFPGATQPPDYYDLTIVGVPPLAAGLEAFVDFVDLFPEDPEDGPPRLWRDFKGEARLRLVYHGSTS